MHTTNNNTDDAYQNPRSQIFQTGSHYSYVSLAVLKLTMQTRLSSSSQVLGLKVYATTANQNSDTLENIFSQYECNNFAGNVIKFQRCKPYDIYKITTLLTGICIVVVYAVCQEPFYYNRMPFTKLCQCKLVQNVICIYSLSISYMCSVP